MKKFLICIWVLCWLFPTPVKAWQPNFELTTPAVVLMDASTKRVLYEKNGNEQRYPASMTKVMTMLLAVEKGNLKDKITLSDYATLSIEYGSSHISLMGGEQITLEDALLATSIVSANDAANGIAEAIGQDQETFVKMMNERALEIGCSNTHFVNPHGLHDKDHYTTPIDMAKIMSEACQNETYLAITSQQSTIIPPTNITSEPRYLYGSNRCMDEEDEFYIPEVISAKAGYTIVSENSYVAYAKKGNAQFVVCLMNAPRGQDYYQDLQTLLDYAFNTYQSYDHLNELYQSPTLPHHFWEIGGKTTLEKPFVIPVYFGDEKLGYHFETTFNSNAKEQQKGEIVGTATLYFDQEIVQKRNIILNKKVQSIPGLILKGILYLLCGLLSLAILTFLGFLLAKKIYTRYRRAKRKKQKK